MQNAELAESRDQMALLLEKFTDLYDFAPIGYFSLDRQGRILELNLTGASLLGSERSALVKRPLARFVAPSCRAAFNEFLNKLFSEAGKQSCEVELLKSGEVAFWASLHGGGEISPADSLEVCRIAISDITSLKLAQEAQHRVEVLSATNDELKREIATRQSVEEALRKSEQHQILLLDKAQLLQNQFRDLSHRAIDAREEERKRISRELHDDITQTLVGITVNLEALAREAALKPGDIRHKIVQTQRIVEKAVRIVHDYARELNPDVVVMDIAMPQMNGLEATRQILEARPGTKVLILSAHNDDVYVDRVLELGAVGYLVKQTSGRFLSEAIREVSKGRVFFSPEVAKRLEKRKEDAIGRKKTLSTFLRCANDLAASSAQ